MSDPTIPNAEPETPKPVPAPERARMSDAAVVWEMLAVLAIGVFPYLLSSLMILTDPWPAERPPYWQDALEMFLLSSFISLAVLYIMYRSDEPWARFGFVRPRWLDLGLSLVFWIAAEWLWTPLVLALPRDAIGDPGLFPPIRHKLDYWLMVPKYAAVAFSEELITRGYLIPRLSRLLRNKVAAIVTAAFLFGSYHLYQGFWGGVVSTLLFGLMFGTFYMLVPRIWPLVIAHALNNVVTELRW